jgi:hypothetical protein
MRKEKERKMVVIGLLTVAVAVSLWRAAASREGYFGWTDRYGIRPPYFNETAEGDAAPEPPFFTANY